MSAIESRDSAGLPRRVVDVSVDMIVAFGGEAA